MSFGLCGRPVGYFLVLRKGSLGVLWRNSGGCTSWNCGSSMRSSRLVAPLASSASVSGTLEEGLLDGGKRPGRTTVAGVDQELVDPAILADPDSCFCEFRGVNIHHKVYDPDSPAHRLLEDDGVAPHQPDLSQSSSLLPMILLHGFGASVYSWDGVMKHLGQITGSKVLAFDRPAFGLTSRVSPTNSSSGSQDVKPLNPYSMAFSMLATMYFMDFLATQKAILIGWVNVHYLDVRHSFVSRMSAEEAATGSLVAVETYFEAPERVAALILIAPAIIAPMFPPRGKKGNRLESNHQTGNKQSAPETKTNLLSRIAGSLSRFMKNIFLVIVQIVDTMGKMISGFYKKVLAALLKSALALILVRVVIDKFGVAAIRNAWHDPAQVTEHILHGYTKPLRCKDWDRALVEYTAAMFLEASTEKPPLSKRLHEISCPVLIITGDNDRLVPSWNAEKLSQAIPESSFEVIRNCGHLPHEEKVEEFVCIVEKFLRRAFVSSNRQ